MAAVSWTRGCDATAPPPRHRGEPGGTQDQPIERDAEYLAFIRTLPCCCCGHLEHDDGQPANHAHHAGRKGKSQRASDMTAVPLCRGCHMDWWHGRGHLPAMTHEESLELFAVTITGCLKLWKGAQ